MMFTKESAESNVDQINSITSILVNATVHKDSTSSKVSVLNANLEKHTMHINKNVPLWVCAKVTTNSTQPPLKLVFAFLNTYVFKEFVQIARQDTITTASVINVVVSLASSRKVDSATQFVPVTKTT